MELKTVSTSTVLQERYLVSYGACGTLGCFIALDQSVCYVRGALVRVRTERGVEAGTVLCQNLTHGISPGLEPPLGQILSEFQELDRSQQVRLDLLGQKVFDVAAQVSKELFLPIKLIDVEAVCEPEAVVLHLLRFGHVDLHLLQTELAKRSQVNVILHDATNPEALEADCSSCGRCEENGESGCGTGACGQCGSAESAQTFKYDWQNYFAKLRHGMERRRE